MNSTSIEEFHPLDRTLRNKLERTVIEARDVAEKGARAALEQLGVGEPRPFEYLGPEAKELRRKLRVHGRQLGDGLNRVTDVQETNLLAEEVAYEHWHRMLFARFLAENNLLMHPDPDVRVPVSLEECEDLAADFGAKNGWELAARFASEMLPQIFRPGSPALDLALPPENQQSLESLLNGLDGDVFQAADSLGWVYQFWQARKKDAVNAPEVKIGAREISAVTQLFTEHYMVSFLLDNSLGAWWAARKLKPADFQAASSEEELRRKASVPGLPLDYLRFVRQEEGGWKLADGSFPDWPTSLAQFKMIDPCCGSGHFLTATFLMLVAMRRAEEGLSVQAATDAVLRENLHGLEIDPRCTEIAAFNLALTAWRVSGYRVLPAPHIACTGLAVGGTREQWMEILASQTVNRNTRFYFEQLHDLFTKAPSLGSLINPHRLLGRGWLPDQNPSGLDNALAVALAGEARLVTERSELGITAQGVAKAAELLGGRYALVATNVPYLGRGKQDKVIREHLETNYPLGKADLATAFVLRCLEFCTKGGTAALVTPQNWLFLSAYAKLRQLLLETRSWNWVARLGEHAFESPAAAGAFGALVILSATVPDDGSLVAGIDVSAPRGQRAIYVEQKAAMLRDTELAHVLVLKQSDQLRNSDSRIAFSPRSDLPLLGSLASSFLGLGTGDFARYGRMFWELPIRTHLWSFHQGPVEKTTEWGGTQFVIAWDDQTNRVRGMEAVDREQIHNQDQSGQQAWARSGVAISLMGELRCSLYTGYRYDKSIAVIIPNSDDLLAPIFSFCADSEFQRTVRQIDQNVMCSNGALTKVAIDIDRWRTVAMEKYPSGLQAPESNDPTQWLFHGRPELSASPLQVSVARLLGFRWPSETDATLQLSKRAKELANSNDELLPFADDDGIICIPPLRGETPAAERLLNLLARAYGPGWNGETLAALVDDVGFSGKSLETWLRDGFFQQHCELFHHRPFIWQIWDGLRDGFSVLVNYHKLDHKNLETLIYTYLGDWISRQKEEIAAGLNGAQERLDAAEVLKKRLELILPGEAPYDIFVRWKPIDKQAIGWEPDINDGVRLNIRPFLSVPDVKARDAGVLRVRPKSVAWDKDRGKEPKRLIQEYPWFWGWDGSVDFAGGPDPTGDRVNDCHYTLAFKRRARELAAKRKANEH